MFVPGVFTPSTVGGTVFKNSGNDDKVVAGLTIVLTTFRSCEQSSAALLWRSSPAGRRILELRDRLANQCGREVRFMLFVSIKAALKRPSLWIG